MNADILKVLLIFMAGGVTVPLIVLVLVLFFSYRSSPQLKDTHEKSSNNLYPQKEKEGWITLTKQFKQKSTFGIQLYAPGIKRQRELYFAKLKGSVLFIYHDKQQDECLMIIPVRHYEVTMFSSKKECKDHEIYGKSTAIKLSPKNDDIEETTLMEQEQSITTNDELFITCARPIDKEDWYFGLLAHSQTKTKEHAETDDIDPSVMESFINNMQKDAAYRESQWLNAIIGRLFLSLHKSDKIKNFIQLKLTKKTQNLKLPNYLGEVIIKNVDIGPSIPSITQPRLLSFTPEGDLMAETAIHYEGGLGVVIQTDLSLMYSSLMKPILVPLVLSIKLKRLSGKVIFKVKPPPTNRCWISFESLPDMDWEITPVVADKQVRISLLTSIFQSKIRQFMKKNLVLPNMKDFPFCPSDSLGGLFGDRVPKPSTPPPSPKMEPGIPFDMLGNKMNKKVVPLKVVESPQVSRTGQYSNPAIRISLFSK